MNSMITFLKPDFSFSDERGFLVQLCREGWKQVNVSGTCAGTRRGGHYHKRNREAFFLVEGRMDMVLERSGEIRKCSANKGDFFVIEPYVVHSFFYPEPAVTVALYDLGVENEDGTKDIFSL